jgi:hypothetical protein
MLGLLVDGRLGLLHGGQSVGILGRQRLQKPRVLLDRGNVDASILQSRTESLLLGLPGKLLFVDLIQANLSIRSVMSACPC